MDHAVEKTVVSDLIRDLVENGEGNVIAPEWAVSEQDVGQKMYERPLVRGAISMKRSSTFSLGCGVVLMAAGTIGSPFAHSAADVFGGMGSWNDIGFSKPQEDEKREYDRVSEELLKAMRQAIMYAVNEW